MILSAAADHHIIEGLLDISGSTLRGAFPLLFLHHKHTINPLSKKHWLLNCIKEILWTNRRKDFVLLALTYQKSMGLNKYTYNYVKFLRSNIPK